MSDDFSDIDGGHEPLFADYEDEDLGDVPALPPPLAILNNPIGGGATLDIGGDNLELSFTQQTNLFADEAADTSRNDQSTAGTANKKRKPLLVYNEGRITSPRGLKAIMDDFPNIKFMGKGHEKSDLKLLMVNYEEWANRMFPKLAFDDIVERTEKLGAKKEVKSLLHQFRSGITLAGEELIDDEDHMSPRVDPVSTGAPATGDHQVEETANSGSDFPDDLMPFGDDVIDQGNTVQPDQVDEWPEDVMDDLPMVDINGIAIPSNQRTGDDMDTSNINDTGVDDHSPSLDNDQSHQGSSLTHCPHVDDKMLSNSQSYQDSPSIHNAHDDQVLEDDQQRNISVCQSTSDHHLDDQDTLLDSVCVNDHNDNSNHAPVDPDKVETQPINDQDDSLTDHNQAISNSESPVPHDQQNQNECNLTDVDELSTQKESSLTHHDQDCQESPVSQDQSQHTLTNIDDQNDSPHNEADDQTDHLFDDFINDV